MTHISTNISSVDAAILRPAELPSKDRGNGAATVPLVGAHLGATTFLNGITTFEPGAVIAHNSHNCVESVAVIEGTAWVDIDGTEHYLNTYDTTFVPANIVHRFRNASDTEPMKIFWTYASIDATRTIAGTTERNRVDEEQGNQPPVIDGNHHVIQEIATLTITPGAGAKFEVAATKAVPLFQKAQGALIWRLDRTIEAPDEYTLTIAWKTIEIHSVGFRESPDFKQWCKLLSLHFAEPPCVKHLEHVYLGF